MEFKVDEGISSTLGSLSCKECANMSSFNTTSLYNQTANATTDYTDYVYYLNGEQVIKDLTPNVYSAGTYTSLFWYAIGLPSNLIAFIVWSKQQTINSAGCYMAALAVADNLFLILHAIMNSKNWCPDCPQISTYPVLCQLLPFLYMAAQYISTLLVLAFTTEQYIAICHPFKRNQYCRVSIARKIIIGVTTFSLALGAPQLYYFQLIKVSEDMRYCIPRENVLEGGTKSIWRVWYFAVDMPIFGAVPTACLLLNLRVLYAVINQRKVQITRNYSGARRGSMRKAKISQATTTVMLLVVSLYWVFTELPTTITNGLREVYQLPEVTSLEEAKDNAGVVRFLNYNTARTIIDIISFSRYSCKFFLYLATGKQFRKNLARLFSESCSCVSSTDNVSISGNTGTSREMEDMKLLTRNDSRNSNNNCNDNNNGYSKRNGFHLGRNNSKQKLARFDSTDEKWNNDSNTEFTSIQEE